MPKYIVSQIPPELIGKLEVQQCLADGRWSPIARVQEVDTDAGYAVVLDAHPHGALIVGPGGQIQTRREQGNFRLVHTATGEINPAIAPPEQSAPLPPTAAAPTPQVVVAMVDTLHQTAQKLPDGNWTSTFAELPEVVAIGATEAEARAAARAQAIEISTAAAAQA